MNAPPLGFGIKFWYGIGQAAEGMKNSSFNAFLLIYYSQVLGLSAIWAGSVLLIALVFDAVTDPLTGSFTDSLRSRWGRRHGFMYAAVLPMTITFYFVFNPPAGLDEGALFAWMLTWVVLARAAMTLYHVPHLALGAELSEDYDERTRVVAFRNFFGFVGAATLFGIAYGVFMRPTSEFASGQLNPAAYPPLGLWFGMAMGVLILISALGTHSRIPYLPRPAESHRFSAAAPLRELLEALRNPSFRVFFAALLIYFISRGVDSALGLYMGTYFWELGSRAVLVPICGLVGVMAGTVWFAVRARAMDKRSMMMIGIIGFSGITLALPISKLVGLFPPMEHLLYLPAIFFFTFLASIFGGAGLIAGGSMLADIADEHELETGRRQEGVFFGALSFSGKSAAGIGNWIAGLALAAIAFPLKAAPGEVDPWIVTKLALVYGPGMLVLMVIGIAVLSRYSLTRERHQAIRVELEQRRGSRAAEFPPGGVIAAAAPAQRRP